MKRSAKGEAVSINDLDIRTLRALVLESQDRLAERDACLAERDARLAKVEEEFSALKRRHQELWKTYERLQEELALLRRRLFVAKAERTDTAQLQLEFEELTAKLDLLAGELDIDPDAPSDSDESGQGATPRAPRSKPSGRRGPADLEGLPKVVVRIADPVMETLVAEGKAKVVGVEKTSQIGYERGGYRHIESERLKYASVNAYGLSEMETAPVPKALLPRCLATPSTLAHIATSKFSDGLPLYRQEEIALREGVSIDRGTMSRWLEQLGGALGATVVQAMDRDARENAFCILTDATGFAIQPGRREDPSQKTGRPCRKGHYFVRIADRDHILFDYTPKHTKAAVHGLFRGFSGYIQADASSVYDALFRSPEEAKKSDPEHDGRERIEVACWSHARRKYWEAALGKQVVAREALLRIGKIFKLDKKLSRGSPPPENLVKKRQQHLRPLVEEFLAFAEVEYAKVRHIRGSLQSALGYTVRQKDAMQVFLRDGRLRLDNNPSEGELRKVVRIRDACFFAGSDEHAESAAGLLTVLASAKLHQLNPERYLRDLIRVLPFWPRERYLELSPKYWVSTRASLDEGQLDAEVGVIEMPIR